MGCVCKMQNEYPESPSPRPIRCWINPTMCPDNNCTISVCPPTGKVFFPERSRHVDLRHASVRSPRSRCVARCNAVSRSSIAVRLFLPFPVYLLVPVQSPPLSSHRGHLLSFQTSLRPYPAKILAPSPSSQRRTEMLKRPAPAPCQ